MTVSNNKTKPPKNIKVGPFNYEIVTDTTLYNAFKIKQEDGESSIGNTDTSTQKIYIQSDLPYEVFAETLFHEVIHVVYYNSAICHMKEVAEEVIVSLISINLLSVLKENPKLVEFLIRKD